MDLVWCPEVGQADKWLTGYETSCDASCFFSHSLPIREGKYRLKDNQLVRVILVCDIWRWDTLNFPSFFFFFFWHHSQNLTFGYWSHSFQTAHIDSSRTAGFLEVLFERPDSRRLVLMTSRHQDLYIWLSLCFWWEESNVCRVFIRVKDSFSEVFLEI